MRKGLTSPAAAAAAPGLAAEQCVRIRTEKRTSDRAAPHRSSPGCDDAEEVILDHNVEVRNLADAPQLAPAIERITARTGCAPGAATADRGYGEASVERDLHELGVRAVTIPRNGKPGATRREFEHRRAFREKIKGRTGFAGRINHTKRSCGWNGSELTGITADARNWCGQGVFGHNPGKIGALTTTTPALRVTPATQQVTGSIHDFADARNRGQLLGNPQSDRMKARARTADQNYPLM